MISSLNRLRGIERVIPSFASDVSILRYPKGGYDEHGREKAQEPEEVTIRGVVQTATDEDLVKVDEGRRTRGGIRIFTPTLLRTASVKEQIQPDVVLWEGLKWQVERIDNWSEYGFHYKAVATRMGQ
jgi:hypothetical protein